mmetsp:Transcript_27579/g.26613  ORF Transcript_27579/g.26613 Transcript_27579/m.26613 type:complete len:101 (-) Transcript_27579:91-393(-)
MDPILIMDDIIEKLHLLDYLKLFCPGKKAISRTYFALKAESEPTEEKVKTFVNLCYWLMNLGEPKKGGNTRYEHFDSKEEAISQVIEDVKKFKVSLPDNL